MILRKEKAPAVTGAKSSVSFCSQNNTAGSARKLPGSSNPAVLETNPVLNELMKETEDAIFQRVRELALSSDDAGEPSRSRGLRMVAPRKVRESRPCTVGIYFV